MMTSTIDDIFRLTEQIRLFQVESDIRKFNNSNELTLPFIKSYRKLKAEQPYHINVIDLLWANENAHSRILVHLLKQNVNKKYEILESFIQSSQSIEQSESEYRKRMLELLVR